MPSTGSISAFRLEPKRIIVALIMLAGITWLALTFNGQRHRAAVLEAVRESPGTVGLMVNSCNQDPFLDEIEETDPGTYEVLVRTKLRETGEACADGVTIKVDPDRESIVIVDRTSGESFDLLGTGEPAPLGLNGIWRMTTVDMGNPVAVGETTAEVPEILIRATEESGVISGNFGCNQLSIEVDFTGDTITGRPETLEGTEELCAIPDGSDKLVLTERSLLKLLAGERASVHLSGDHLEIGTLNTNAVFERVAP